MQTKINSSYDCMYNKNINTKLYIKIMQKRVLVFTIVLYITAIKQADVIYGCNLPMWLLKHWGADVQGYLLFMDCVAVQL